MRIRRLSAHVVAVLTAALTAWAIPGALPSDAGTTAPTLTVELKPDVARMDDGIVEVIAWTTCSPGLTAFELDLSVNQGSSFGSQSMLFSGVVPCDGLRHETRMSISAETGRFEPGPATLSAYLAANQGGGGDIEATDEANVTLRQIWHPAIVQIRERPTRISPDGSVRVVFWYRCLAKYNAYALNVGVFQDDVYASYEKYTPPAVVTCDGTRHRWARNLAPTSGSFHQGLAVVGVFIGLYDTVEDHDADLNEDVTLRLRPALS